MEIKKAQMMATDLIGYYCPEYKFKFDNAKWRFGLCQYTKKRISISSQLTLANDEKEVLDTVLHEIAHALSTFNEGHGENWKMKAKQIGCSGERCYDSTTVVTAPKTWIGTCPGCDRKISRYRRKRISCGKCSGGSFNLDYLFDWIEVNELEKEI